MGSPTVSDALLLVNGIEPEERGAPLHPGARSGRTPPVADRPTPRSPRWPAS